MRRSSLLLLTTCLAILSFWSYITCIAAVAYGYLYWMHPAGLQYAVPSGRAEKADSAPKDPAALRLDSRPVPKLIHQTWMTLSKEPSPVADGVLPPQREMPGNWKAAQKTCSDLHPDYEFKLWDDSAALTLIKEHYPWFLPTYISYPYGIQRVDAVRYFILHHYGGIYLDLDMACSRRLDFLRNHNFTAPLARPTGISNSFMAGAPRTPYLKAATEALPRWNKWMGIKYVQVMFSTGPMFMTVLYATFPRKADVAVVPLELFGDFNTSAGVHLYHLHGSSWHAEDAALVFWLQRHQTMLLTFCALAALSAVVFLVCPRCLASNKNGKRVPSELNFKATV